MVYLSSPLEPILGTFNSLRLKALHAFTKPVHYKTLCSANYLSSVIALPAVGLDL